mmetsp:Transcript_94924/g.245109  ORF Transcript_94924/g.245109 Transcript_94924/m.245109 type:complete len:241 (+) Transcript_94924:1498-2220(+)
MAADGPVAAARQPERLEQIGDVALDLPLVLELGKVRSRQPKPCREVYGLARCLRGEELVLLHHVGNTRSQPPRLNTPPVDAQVPVNTEDPVIQLPARQDIQQCALACTRGAKDATQLSGPRAACTSGQNRGLPSHHAHVPLERRRLRREQRAEAAPPVQQRLRRRRVRPEEVDNSVRPGGSGAIRGLRAIAWVDLRRGPRYAIHVAGASAAEHGHQCAAQRRRGAAAGGGLCPAIRRLLA